MSDHPTITRIETVTYVYEAPDMGWDAATRVFLYAPGERITLPAYAIRMHTDTGITGEYVYPWSVEHAAVGSLAGWLLGRNALEREAFYHHAKHATRHHAQLGMSVLDIALWDVAGKHYGLPVHRLIGGGRSRLPAYASTYVGDRVDGGLDWPGAWADFAERCLDLGYRAYKIHGWYPGTGDEHASIVRAVGERMAGRMVLMHDASSVLPTFADALKVGRACDDHGFFWLEDPFTDPGVSAEAHRRLRQRVRTPLLQGEHFRGLEKKVDFIAAEATDLVRADPDFDGGITGALKIASAAEAFGLDCELHMCGPAKRQLMAVLPNSNYYEMGLVHPGFGTWTGVGPVFADGYRDELEAIDADGCVPVPTGPGLGVTYDWGFIERHRTDGSVWEL